MKPSSRGSFSPVTTGWRAAPVASSRSVSEVEVSLSTVMALNEASVASAKSGCRIEAGRAASVTAKASMVAMSGAIMPEPLAMPAMVTATPSISTLAAAPLGKVSVVMIARAAASTPSPRSSVASSATRLVIFSTGSRWPITPVEATKISSGRQPRAWATASASARTAASPSGPRNTLALPALMITARARPDGRISRHQTTGCPAVVERVNTPATVLPGATSISVRSSRSR